MLLTSSTWVRPAWSRSRSTPAYSAPTLATARRASSESSRRGGQRFRCAASADIGDPVGGPPGHCGDDFAGADEQALILEPGAGLGDVVLKVIDAADRIGRRQVLLPLDQAQAAALRSEQRFQHQLVMLRLAADDRAGCFQPLDGPGRRRRQAGLGEKEAGGRFVHAPLYRAGVVPHRHAEFAQRMQDAEPARHLFKAAAGNGAHQYRIGKGVREPGDLDAVPALGVECAGGEVYCFGVRLTGGEGSQQGACVPVRAVDRQRDSHQLNEASSSAWSISPLRKVLPESILVTIASAGLNSIGSMA